MTVKVQNTYYVSVPPRSAGTAIHAAIADLDSHRRQVNLMAASMSFATPAEICGLRALVEYAAERADTVFFDCPSADDVHRYLARVDFYEKLPGNVALSRPVPGLRRKDRRSQLIELVRVRSAGDVEHLMERVHRVAGAHLGTGPAAIACATAIGEATSNVLDHAESRNGAFVAAQRYTATTGLEVAIVDLGVGIPVTLARNPAHRGLSDLTAVQRSLQNGVSRITDPGRGTGLAELVKAVGRAGTASLRIGSRRAQLTIGWRGGCERQQATAPACPVPGTWIAVTLET
jgi:anti-sigma regulatory factor (Ser/Thr protein kinase)